MATLFPNLKTLAEQQATPVKAQPKGESRLQKKADETTDERKEERRWKAEVWKRDKGCCRWCLRKVTKTVSLVPERGEVHHVAGRVVKAIRWLRKNGALLCAACHERITGKVNERFLIVAAKTYTIDGVQYPDADKKLSFKRVA